MNELINFFINNGADLLIAVSLLFYCGCLIPQIIENYQIKSTHGLSDLFILFYFNGYNAMLYYVYCGNLAWAYKLMLPVECCLILTIITQRLYYGNEDESPRFKAMLGLSLLTLLVVLVPAFYWPAQTSIIAGWVAMITFTFNQLPQIIKIVRERSTEGFSFGFVSMLAFAQLCELTGGILNHMPMPTIAMAARGLVVYAIYCTQFALYRKRS